MKDCLSKPSSDDFVASVNEEKTSSVVAGEGDGVVKETSRNITENPELVVNLIRLVHGCL